MYEKFAKFLADFDSWKSETEDVLTFRFGQLVGKGFTEDEAIEILESLCHVISDEYGD